MKERDIQEARDLAEECDANLFKAEPRQPSQVRIGGFDKALFDSRGELILDLSSAADAEFCVGARETILKLVAELEALREERLEKAVRAVWTLHDDGDELDPDDFEAALRGALFPEK